MKQDVLAGGLLVMAGAAFVVTGWKLDAGTVARMGPGFVPIALGWIQIVIGLIVGYKGAVSAGLQVARPVFRSLFFVFGAILVFAALIEKAGLIVSAALTMWMVSFAVDGSGYLRGSVFVLTMSVLCSVVFIDLLGMRMHYFPAFLR